MNEVLTLLLVILLIYFLECFSIVPESNFVFRVRWLHRWTPAESLFRIERSQTRIYLSNILPGFGDIAVCATPPSGATPAEHGETEQLRRMLDTKAARRRLHAYRRVLRPLYWDSYLMLAVVFLFFPLVALRFGIWIALFLVPAFLLGVVHMVCAFRRVHRAFEPDAVRERREKTVALVFSPLGAMRVPSSLLRNSLAGFHPLAVAAASMPPAEARLVASRILRQLRFDRPEREGLDGPQAQTNDEQITVVWEWAAREFGDLESLLGPPQKRYPDSISFCPRCEQEYVLTAGECSDCPGISLETFPVAKALFPARTQRRRARR